MKNYLAQFWKWLGKHLSPKWRDWFVGAFFAAIASIVWLIFTGEKKPLNLPSVPEEPLFNASFGMVPATPEEIAKVEKEIEAIQGFPARFAAVAKDAIESDNNKSVFLWEAEQKVMGKLLPCWNQNPVGSCVANGWPRAIQDALFIQIANGSGEAFPSGQICREAMYGGSRVQIGKGVIRGDGSTGPWMARFVSEYGVLYEIKYPSHDLSQGRLWEDGTHYDPDRCRAWGNSGCPAELLPEAKKVPVKGVARVNSAAEVWAAIGNGYPVAECSIVGYGRGNGFQPQIEGFCQKGTNWPHCMEIRGRFNHPTRGRCFVIQNSWGDYLKADGVKNVIETVDRGRVVLPIGCFAVPASDVDDMCSPQWEGQTYAVSAVVGFPKQKLDWTDFVRVQPQSPVPFGMRHWFEDKQFALLP